MAQQCLASECRVILKEIVDVPNPVIIFPRTGGLVVFPFVARLDDGGSVDTGDRVRGCLDVDVFTGMQNMGGSAIH